MRRRTLSALLASSPCWQSPSRSSWRDCERGRSPGSSPICVTRPCKGRGPMAKFSQKKIKDFFAKSDAATTKAEKGKHLEDLAVYLFEMVPGISMSARDKKNVYESEE